MYKLLGGLKEYFKLQEIQTDNAVFRLHNVFTTVLLLTCSLVITATQYVGNPISCIVSGIPTHVVNTFCWISSTFTMPDAYRRQVMTGEGKGQAMLSRYALRSIRVQFHLSDAHSLASISKLIKLNVCPLSHAFDDQIWTRNVAFFGGKCASLNVAASECASLCYVIILRSKKSYCCCLQEREERE